MFHEIEENVHVHPLNLEHCQHEEIYTRVDQIVDSNNVLRDIREVYCCALKKSARHYNYNYARGSA